MNNSLFSFSRATDSRVLMGGVAVALLIAIFWGYSVRAADEATVAATVSATNLAVSVADGSIAFGSVALNTATTTVTGNDTQVVTNDGSTAQLNVKAINATGGTGWTLAAATGVLNEFKLEVSTTTGSTYMTLSDNVYITASSTFPTGAVTQNLDFRLTTPSSSSDFVQKSITITVQVTSI
jgi:hypothetical protein